MDGADGADKIDRANGADGADRADGTNGADRANKVDGVDGIDRADKAEGDGADAEKLGDPENSGLEDPQIER